MRQKGRNVKGHDKKKVGEAAVACAKFGLIDIERERENVCVRARACARVPPRTREKKYLIRMHLSQSRRLPFRLSASSTPF